MSTQEHTIDIEFDGEGYIARLEPSLPGLETPFSAQESLTVFRAVMNWLKTLGPDGNRRSDDDGRFIIFRIHESAYKDGDERWGILTWSVRWPYRQLLVDESGIAKHHQVKYGSAVVVKLLEEAGGSTTSSKIIRGKTEDGDTIWNHLVPGQDVTDLLGPLAQSGVISWDEDGCVTLLDTTGSPIQSQ